jgi:hypothetical protein
MGATVGQGLCWNGTQWAPGICAGGSIPTPIPNADLTLTNSTQNSTPNSQFVALTDGSGDGGAGLCVVFGSTQRGFFRVNNGLLVAANPSNPNNAGQAVCLMGTGSTFAIAPGQTLVTEDGSPAQGLIRGNLFRDYFTVASLPICNTAAIDTHAAVRDALSPSYLGALTGGGTVYTPVVCNGTAWVAY